MSMSFVWDCFTPSTSTNSGGIPVGQGNPPLSVTTQIDPDDLDDITGYLIHWGDGTSTTISTNDFGIEADHVYTKAGSFTATCTSQGPLPSVTHELIFHVLALNGRLRSRAVHFSL